MKTVSLLMVKDVDMVANILSVYEYMRRESSAVDLHNAITWYPKAYMLCVDAAQALDIPTHVFVGIVAATSPRLHWDRNIGVAMAVVSRLRRGQDSSGIMVTKMNFGKCSRIFNGENPEDVLGQKTRNFYRNIIGGTDNVTIDAHACNVAINGLEGKASGDIAPAPNAYALIAQAYKDAAIALGVAPAELQAVTWGFYAANKGKVA